MQSRAVIAGLAAVGIFGCVPASAQVCHPDPLGTRTLLVHGSVTGYAMNGRHVELGFRDKDGCVHLVSWNVGTAPMRRVVTATTGCRRFGVLGSGVRVPDVAPAAVAAFDGSRHVVVTGATITVFVGKRRAGVIRRHSAQPPLKAELRSSRLIVLGQGSEPADRPDRLEVYDTSTLRSLGSWPLIEPAVTLDLAGDTALFSSKNRKGVYALRLEDGATRLVAPAWNGDTPQIEPAGVVYEDGSFARDRATGRVPVKFVPTYALRQEFAEVHRTLRTDGPITGLAMNGPNLAVTFRGPANECDQVRIWQVFWQDIATPTMDRGPGCSRHDRIQAVAETGISAWWTVRAGSVQRLVWSSSENCVQHLVARASAAAGDRFLAISGDSRSIAYAVGHEDGTSTLALSGSASRWATRRIHLSDAPRAVVSDEDRVAVLDANGNVSLRSINGDEAKSLDVRDARRIALRGDLLATASGANVDLYKVSSGERIATWNVGGPVSGLSMRYGIVVVIAGHDVVALRMTDGKRVRLARTGGFPLAVVDRAGIAFASSAFGRGLVTFVPMADVERAFSR
jgi:hypothetical protein